MLEEAPAFRESAIDLLDLLASAELQREYQRNVPQTNVPTELVCMWFDDFWNFTEGPPSAEHAEEWNASVERFRRCFSAQELAAMEAFHEFYDAREPSLPMEDIEGLLAWPAWREIMVKAKETLAVFGSR